jgi:hypothetical protein
MRSIKKWPGLLGYSKIGYGFFLTQARKRFSLALLLDFTFVNCNEMQVIFCGQLAGCVL